MKASRAKRLLQKRASLKEERKAAAEASGVDCSSHESDDELVRNHLMFGLGKCLFLFPWTS